MSTNFGAMESSSDAVNSSELPSNSHIALSNGGKVVVGDNLSDSKTETLTMEPFSDKDKGVDVAVQDSVDEVRVSGDEVGIEMKKGEKGLNESSSDAVVLSAPESNSDIPASNGAEIGANLLEWNTETVTKEPSCDHDRGGDILVLDSISDARVSGDEKETVLENVEKVLNESSSNDVIPSVPANNDDIAANNRVNIGDDLKTETLTSDHGGGGEVAVEDSVDEVRVSGNETGIAMESVEKVLDGLNSYAAVSSLPESNIDVAASNGVEIGSELLESKTETLTMEPTSDHVAVQDSVDEVRVFGDKMKALDESNSDIVVSSVPPSNNHIPPCNEVEIEAELLQSKTETLIMELSSDHDAGGDTVIQDPIDEARVSGDQKVIVMENDEKVLDESNSHAKIAANNRVNIGANLLDSKTETLTTEPSSDHNGGDDIVVQDSIDEARVSEDKKATVTENFEKNLDENMVNNEEKEGEYKVTDLVWAKVRSYPWWPGQIFDPSASTDKAKKHANKKGFLIAYFGDQSFAWNEASKIKPFRKHFSKMEKQSNSKAFIHAVNCALDEVSRRIDFGLTCSCLSKEVYNSIKSQVFVNAGIKKEFSKIDGGDNFSTVASFKSENIVQTVQDLAREHFDGFSKLEVISVRTQLLACNRWKGYNQLKTQNLVEELDIKLEDNSEIPLVEKDEVIEDEKIKSASVSEKSSSKKRKLNDSDSVPNKKERQLKNVTTKEDKVIEDEKPKSASVSEKNSSKKSKLNVSEKKSSQKRKLNDSDSDSDASKKERSLSSSLSNGKKKMKKNDGKKEIEFNGVKKEKRDETNDKKSFLKNVTSKASSSVSNGKNKMKKINGKKANIENKGVKEENRNENDKKSPILTPKPLFRIGDRICRIAKQLSESPSFLKKVPEKSDHVIEKSSEKRENNDDNNCDEQTKNSETKTETGTALILKFTNLDSIPSVTELNEIFNRYGPVKESETEVLKKSSCVKVVFEVKLDAETAFSSAGKFSIFGPSLISYRLDYSPTVKKTPITYKKRNKKDKKSVEKIPVAEGGR